MPLDLALAAGWTYSGPLGDDFVPGISGMYLSPGAGSGLPVRGSLFLVSGLNLLVL